MNHHLSSSTLIFLCLRTVGFPDYCAAQLNKTHKSILFLGNSYTYFNDLPNMVKQLASAAGFSATTQSITPGGQTLTGHVSGSLGTITSGNFDVVIIQGQSQRPSFPTGYVRLILSQPNLTVAVTKQCIGNHPPTTTTRYIISRKWL